MAYSLDVRQRSRDLFVEASQSYEDVSKETGVAVNTLKQWGVAGKWTDQREQYQRDYSDFHAKVSRLKLKLAEKALENEDAAAMSQSVYALSSLMRANHASANGAAAQDKPQWFIECMQKFLEFVKNRDPDALRHLEPHVGAFAEVVRQG